jgi:DNA-binding transcriptional LysR family regulator
LKRDAGIKSIDYQLRQFVKVATHKSLSEAAIALNVTQSALSKQLREIESSVGQQVFRRHGRGIELTEQGDVLSRAIQAAYKLVDTTVDRLRTTSSHDAVGALRVATIHGFADLVVNELLVTVLGQCAEINLIMMSGSAADVCRLVETGMADVGYIDDKSSIPDTLAISGSQRTGHDSQLRCLVAIQAKPAPIQRAANT